MVVEGLRRLLEVVSPSLGLPKSMTDREAAFAGYVAGGIYGALAWYWYRRGMRDERKLHTVEDSERPLSERSDVLPCSDCPEPDTDSPSRTSRARV